jgi:uncharacterized Rmd1/YagE family protein
LQLDKSSHLSRFEDRLDPAITQSK